MTAAVQYRARPTVYNGIQMRSRLEARVAYMLDGMGIVWQYEPRAYKAAAGEYLPDFQLGPTTFLEVKGVLNEGTAASIERAFRVLKEAVPGFRLWVLVADGDCAIANRDGVIVQGQLRVCDGCRRPHVGTEPGPCSCGGEWTDAEDWLAWQP